jgi:hypothetical protein
VPAPAAAAGAQSVLPAKQEDEPMRALRALLIVALFGTLSGCGYNTIQSRDEAVKAAWAEV